MAYVHPVHNARNPSRTLDGLKFASTRDRHVFPPNLASSLGFIDIFSSRFSKYVAVKALKACPPAQNGAGQVIYPPYLYVHPLLCCHACGPPRAYQNGAELSTMSLEIDESCLWDRIDATDRPGGFRLGQCFRHRLSTGPTATSTSDGKSCELEGTKIILSVLPSLAEWEQWKLLGWPREARGYSVMLPEGGQDLFVSPAGVLFLGVAAQGSNGKRARWSYLPELVLHKKKGEDEVGGDASLVAKRERLEEVEVTSSTGSTTARFKRRKTEGYIPPSPPPTTTRPASLGPMSTSLAPSAQPLSASTSRYPPLSPDTPSSAAMQTPPTSTRESDSSPLFKDGDESVDADVPTPEARRILKLLKPGTVTLSQSSDSSATTQSNDEAPARQLPNLASKPGGMAANDSHALSTPDSVHDITSDTAYPTTYKGIKAAIRDLAPKHANILLTLLDRYLDGDAFHEVNKALAEKAAMKKRLFALGLELSGLKADSKEDKAELAKAKRDIDVVRAERDGAITERDAAITARDTATAGWDGAKLQGDEIGKERDLAIEQRDKASLQRDKESDKVRQTIKQRDEAVLERDRLAGEMRVLQEGHAQQMRDAHTRAVSSLQELAARCDAEKQSALAEAAKVLDGAVKAQRRLEDRLKAMSSQVAIPAPRSKTTGDDIEERHKELLEEHEELKRTAALKDRRIARLNERVHELASGLEGERDERIKAARVISRLAKSLERGYEDILALEGSDEDSGEEEEEEKDVPVSRRVLAAQALARRGQR